MGVTRERECGRHVVVGWGGVERGESRKKKRDSFVNIEMSNAKRKVHFIPSRTQNRFKKETKYKGEVLVLHSLNNSVYSISTTCTKQNHYCY